MQEPEFKDYKEKQRYYRRKSKDFDWVWISTELDYDKKNKNNIVKGRTYVKKEQESAGDK